MRAGSDMLHRLTETDRRLALDERRFIQGGINLDEVEVSLEEGGAFSACDTVLLTMERDGIAPVPVRLDTMRVAVPASLMDVPGTLRFSLTGYVGNEVRATTERMRADKCGRVVPSGIIGGGPAPQDAAPDLWKQLMDDVDAATAGAEETLERAEDAAKRAEGAASDAAAASSSAADSESKASAAASAASDSASSAASAAGTAADFATGAGNAKTAAETARTDAESARDAAETAQKGAESAKTAAEAEKAAAEKAKTDAETASTAASNSASQAATSAESAASSAQRAADSAQTASEKAASVLDHYIESATATTLDPGSEATATVADKVLRLGIPRGEAATVSVGSVTTGEPGTQAQVVDSGTPGAPVLDFTIPRGDPGDVSAVTAAEGSDISVSTDEGTVTIDDFALRARIAELENQAANVVTGTSTDLVAHGEDAYAQKPREVRVKGKTWVNRWPVIEGSVNGITVTTDETGLITVTGTSTNDSYIYAIASGIRAGVSITCKLSISAPTDNTWTPYIEIVGNEGAYIKSGQLNGSTTIPSNAVDIRCGIHVYVGQTVNASFRVMLVDGTEAPDCFTPPASITSAKPENLVTSGKNLVDASTATLYNGIGVPDFVDNGFYIDNLDGIGGKRIVRIPVHLIQGQYYTASFDSELVDGTDENNKVNFFLPEIQQYTDGTNNTITFRPRQTTTDIGLYCDSQDLAKWKITNLQLELGSTATPYKPPTVTTTPLPEVELRGLPNGTCDELVINGDGTCEVERKTGYIASYTDEEVTGEYVSTGNGLEAGASIVYELDEPTTEPQSPVTLPTLPAPTFNQYHDSAVPSDTSTEYVRDINIVLDNLAKQVAGTASAVAVREASTIEEE